MRTDRPTGIRPTEDVPWPIGPSGEPVRAIFLLNCPNFAAYDEVTITHLRAYGIPVVTRYPETGGLGRIYMGFSGYGVDLYVPQSRLEEAQALLEPTENEEEL